MLKRSFLFNLCVPCTAALLAIGTEYSGLDLWLSRFFYDADLGLWPYRSYWLTEDLLHRGGRHLVVALAVVVLLLFIGSFMRAGLKPYRKDFAFVLLAGLSGPAVVGAFKALSHIYSPWDLQLFGGVQPYLRIFDAVPADAPVGHAFPAGHASGGFAWFSVFFALRRHVVPFYQVSLLLPLLLGFGFGIAQQARGAHFFSHDLATLGTCWLCAVIWTRVFYAREPQTATAGKRLPDLISAASQGK